MDITYYAEEKNEETTYHVELADTRISYTPNEFISAPLLISALISDTYRKNETNIRNLNKPPHDPKYRALTFKEEKQLLNALKTKHERTKEKYFFIASRQQQAG